MLAGDLIVRVQAEPDIFCPELPRFRQQRHDRRGHLPVLGRQRPLLAVARAGVRQDLAHDPARDAAHVAVRVHEQLVEEHQRLALVGPCHIGAVFLQQPQIHADALEIFFALGLLEQLLERLVGRERVHEADRAVQRQVPQGTQRLRRVHERGVLRLVRQKLVIFQPGADAAAQEQVFKVGQLVVDVAVAERLFLRHVGQLAEDHLVGLGERMDAHDLFFARLPRAAHAEIRVDEQQRLDGQVFKFQIPGRVVGGDVADLLHPVPAEPLPGIIIVQIGDAPEVLAAAAELADVVPQRRRTHERQIDREARPLRQNRRMQGDIVHADGVRGGVEGRRLHPQAHNGHQMVLPHGLGKQAVLPLHAAAGDGILRQGQKVEAGVKAVRRVLQRGLERGKIAFLVRRQRRDLRQAVGEHPAAELLVERRQKGLRGRRRRFKLRRAERQHRGAQIPPVRVKSGKQNTDLVRHGNILCNPIRSIVVTSDFTRFGRKSKGHLRIIRQEHSARDFGLDQSLKSEGILYGFRVFQTAEAGQKIRRMPQTQLCGDA